MKFRILNILLVFNLLVSTPLVFGLTGMTPEEDDCPSKYNAFREERAALQKIISDFSAAQYRLCLRRGCSQIYLNREALNAMMRSCSTVCNNLSGLLPFPPSASEISQLRAAYNSAVEAIANGVLNADDILAAMKADTNLSSRMIAALQALLPPDWAAVSQQLQQDCDMVQYRRDHANSNIAEVDQAFADNELDWAEHMDSFIEATTKIARVCDPSFLALSPVKPDFNCDSVFISHDPTIQGCVIGRDW